MAKDIAQFREILRHELPSLRPLFFPSDIKKQFEMTVDHHNIILFG
jgi:hypothetical protein